MNNRGIPIYYAGVAILVFLWIFVQPTYFPMPQPWDLFVGFGVLMGWFYVCRSGFPIETDPYKCRGCGHDYKKWEVPEDVPVVYQCPNCPEEDEDVQEHTE